MISRALSLGHRVHSHILPEDDQSILIETSSCKPPVLFRNICASKDTFYMVSPQIVFTYQECNLTKVQKS